MMFNIKIKYVKLLHSYPDNQLCKKSKCWMFSYTFTRVHTKIKIIQKKTIIYSIKWQMYSKKTKTQPKPNRKSHWYKWVNQRTMIPPVACQSLCHENLITYIAIAMGMLKQPEPREITKTLAHGLVRKNIHSCVLVQKKELISVAQFKNKLNQLSNGYRLCGSRGPLKRRNPLYRFRSLCHSHG